MFQAQEIDVVKQVLRPTPFLSEPDISVPKNLMVGAPDAMAQLVHETRPPPRHFDTVELVRLYQAIGEGIDHKSGAMVQVVSTSSPAQAAELVYGVAWAGASLLGKRVLFIDMTGRTSAQLSVLSPSARARNETDPGFGQALTTLPAEEDREAGVYLASFSHDYASGQLPAVPKMKSLLRDVAPLFDLVLIASPPALESPLAAALNSFADGSILLLEAGRARYRPVARAIEILSGSQASFLGVVFAKRVNEIPRWLRRWLWV